jgi:hypothetical protein
MPWCFRSIAIVTGAIACGHLIGCQGAAGTAAAPPPEEPSRGWPASRPMIRAVRRHPDPLQYHVEQLQGADRTLLREVTDAVETARARLKIQGDADARAMAELREALWILGEWEKLMAEREQLLKALRPSTEGE